MRLWTVLAILILTEPVYARNNCEISLTPTAVHHLLHDRRESVLSQKDRTLRFGSVACGNVCGANLLQSLRVALGRFPRPHLANLVNQLMNGDRRYQNGLNAGDFKKFVEELTPTMLPDTEVVITASEFSGANTRAQNHRGLTVDDLQAGAETAQALLLVPVNQNGVPVATAHWFLLSHLGSDRKIVTLSDPYAPAEEVDFIPSRQNGEDAVGDFETVSLAPELPLAATRLPEGTAELALQAIVTVTAASPR